MPKKALPRALQLQEDGLVTRAGLTAAGVDDDLADRLVREGSWTRLAPSGLPDARPAALGRSAGGGGEAARGA
jgi:hypothetical protein